jgi:crossover junction endodeoxyribonuclease RusA
MPGGNSRSPSLIDSATKSGRIAASGDRAAHEPSQCSLSRPSGEHPFRVAIELPFPSAKLSGHAKGKWWNTSGIVAKHREWAAKATLEALIPVPDAGDIRVAVTFYPPDRRGDRVNFPNRMKPYWDGIADALGVNDSRFLPAFYYAEPTKDARVMVEIGGQAARTVDHWWAVSLLESLLPFIRFAQANGAPNAAFYADYLDSLIWRREASAGETRRAETPENNDAAK